MCFFKFFLLLKIQSFINDIKSIKMGILNALLSIYTESAIWEQNINLKQ